MNAGPYRGGIRFKRCSFYDFALYYFKTTLLHYFCYICKYEIKNVDFFLKECGVNPCGPGATCIDSHRGFSCQCAKGYTGPTCHEQIDNCEANNQCKNDGDCINGVDTFKCKCKPGYAGER